MADKLMIVLMNTDAADASGVGAAFSQATVAAAMEYDVEMILAGRAVDLARRGVADQRVVDNAGGKTAYDLIQEAHQAGVTLKVCTPTLGTWEDDLIPEIEETVGDAYLISEAMDDETVTFTY